MRVFFSGNEELARHHLPIVKSVANSFAERCKKAGLSQNAMAFSFNDTGAHASIQYVFGQLNVQISAPFTTSEGGTTETFKSKRAIWIRTFDEDVWYSYNGMFFSLWDFIEPVYEPSELKITDVEQHIAVDAGARTITPVKGSIQFTKILGPYGIDAVFAECLYQKEGSGYQNVGSENVVEGFAYGYNPCAFYVPRSNELRWQAGGDAVFKDEFPVVAGEHMFNTMVCFPWASPRHEPADCVCDSCDATHGISASYLLGPTWDAFEQDFREAFSDISIDPDLAVSLFLGTGERPAVTDSQVFLPTEFVTLYYEGNPEATITSRELHDWYDDYSGLDLWLGYVNISAGDGAVLVIKMVDVDGTVVSQSIPAVTMDGLTCKAGEHGWIPSHGGSGGTLVALMVTGAAMPEVHSGAPRGYIHFVFTRYPSGSRAIAYSKQEGWKKCVPIPSFYSQRITPSLFLGPYAEVYVSLGAPNYRQFYLVLAYYRKAFDVAKDRFSYSGHLTIKTALSDSLSDLKNGIVIFSENGRYVSLYNCQGLQNGIYDIRTTTFMLVHLYDDTEIEPIFMDDVAGVICTKRAIYLDHGARSLLCTECCGMFLDHTHYVDKLADGSFVLNKIVEEDGLHGEMVDSLQAGAYNFYEFSEDGSVCIISNYYMYPEDPQPSSPAIVLDYADPVYRFEPSDQIILQYMSPQLYAPTDENKRVGHPNGVPLGSKYINLCECHPTSRPARIHSVFCAPPNGTGTFEAKQVDYISLSMCPLETGSYIRYGNKRPTIVPQYSTAAVNRRDYRYDGKRLNRHIYHHTGKILRRISEELEPIDVEFETTITRSV